MKERIKELRKKGFTLIELIVVIAVLGILVLLAAPKFLGYTADAKMKQIQNDIRTFENEVSAQLTKNPELEESFTALSAQEIQDIENSGKALNKKGQPVQDITDVVYVLDLEKVNSKLKGQFLWTDNDEVIYYDPNLTLDETGNGGSGDGTGNGGSGDGTGNGGSGDGTGTGGSGAGTEVTEGNGQGEENQDPPVMLTDADFTWVPYWNGYYSEESPSEKGYYSYTGTGEEVVEIPEYINGTKLTTYYRMFYETGADVKKVVSSSDSVTNMSYMFERTKATELDVSGLNTTNVTNIRDMFAESETKNISLNGLYTGKVSNMVSLFRGSKVESVDLTGIDTSSVSSTGMQSLFQNTKQLQSVDLSSFNTSKVGSMSNMFSNSSVKSIVFGENWDTKEVVNMTAMFYGVKMDALDLSKFNTQNLNNATQMFANAEIGSVDFSNFYSEDFTVADSMFANSKIDVIDLSKLNTSKAASVDRMKDMFAGASATVGYAKTQEDADRLNATTNKPSTLVFTMKP